MYPKDFPDLTVSGLNQSIINTGAVLVYYKLDTESWQALPMTIFESGFTYNVNFSFKVGMVTLRRYDDDFNSGWQLGTFRVVTLEGEAGKNSPTIDYNNYIEVAEYYGLPLD